MTQEPRKATDVLIEIESMVRSLLDMVRAQDLNIKVLSNKLNDVCAKLDKHQQSSPKIIVEAVQATPTQNLTMARNFPQMPSGDLDRNIPISAEMALPQENSPQGFRRTSRPETYAGDNAYLKKQSKTQICKSPPGRSITPEIIVPSQPPSPQNKKTATQKPLINVPPPQQSTQGQIPVMQRCVDKNGKSIFLADVHITDMATNQHIFKL